MISSLSSEAEPSLLLRRCGLLLFLGGLLNDIGYLPGIAHVIPGDVEEKGLHRNGFDLRGVSDQVIEIDILCRVF